MRRVKFIYNPHSGEGRIIRSLDKIIDIYQSAGYLPEPFRLDGGQPPDIALRDVSPATHDHLLIAGGDGTVGQTVNAMNALGLSIPVGLLPTGTANDFARCLGMPHKISDACRRILHSTPTPIDIGSANGRRFVNVAGAGLFTDVSQKTSPNLKQAIGKLAYYLKGLETLQRIRSIPMRITADGNRFEGDTYFLLVLNGRTAGRIRFAPKANITDGKLDLLIIRAMPVIELLPLFIRILNGESVESNRVLRMRAADITVDCDSLDATDLDGEPGPTFPIHIRCLPGALRVKGYTP